MRILKRLLYILICIVVITHCKSGTNNNQTNNQLLLGLLVALNQDQVITRSTGKMNNPQHTHTATLLNNGKVLIVGRGAELYDPETEMFTVIEDSSKINIFSHQSVLLSNGKVLVMGGEMNGTNQILSTAMLYDPETNTFSDTGNMITKRTVFIATLLNNGKVFIAGGYDGGKISSSELYDPDTGMFSDAGSNETPSRAFKSVLLESGKVLYGGILYDPDASTFTKISGFFNFDFSSRRQCCTILTKLDDGRILTYIFPEYNENTQLSIYDPNSETFTETSQYIGVGLIPNSETDQYTRYQGLIPFIKSVVQLNSGNVLITGGSVTKIESPGSVFLSKAVKGIEQYDPNSNKISFLGNMKTPRSGHTATLLQDGRVLITGGFTKEDFSNEYELLSTAEIYSP